MFCFRSPLIMISKFDPSNSLQNYFHEILATLRLPALHLLRNLTCFCWWLVNHILKFRSSIDFWAPRPGTASCPAEHQLSKFILAPSLPPLLSWNFLIDLFLYRYILQVDSEVSCCEELLSSAYLSKKNSHVALALTTTSLFLS